MLEIVVGVNMRGMFLQFLFAGAFLTSGFGDTLVWLVLSERNGRAKSCEAHKKNCERSETVGTRDSPAACAARLGGQRAAWVSQQHGKPTTGGHRVRRIVVGERADRKIISCGISWK